MNQHFSAASASSACFIRPQNTRTTATANSKKPSRHFEFVYLFAGKLDRQIARTLFMYEYMRRWAMPVKIVRPTANLINFRFTIAAAAIICAVLPARAADIDVVLDRATLVKLPDRVGTVIVGNPLIADVSVQPGGQLVVTGKGYGVTNIIALDRAGKILLEQTVEVQGPKQDVVVVYRGIERESYSCTPNCERRITLGDAQPYFDATLTQTGTRSSQAQSKDTAR
jgi:Flp pilus assembly secretin CpaC